VSRIEQLKEEARGFEQDEQWGKALDLYSQAIDQTSAEDTPDIALFNRAGDLATKVGSAAQAVAFYERAVDLYMDAELPNNAIAVCKKVMRNLPDRHSIHLKMGHIRARQGFITDARTSFVTYAERVRAAGDLDEDLRALIKFVNLAPDDYEMGMMLASQLEHNNRTDDAIAQYVGAYRSMQRQGLGDLAASVAAKVRKLKPDLDVDAAAADPSFGRAAVVGAEGEDSKGSAKPVAEELEVIGPVDLPLMSFNDEDEADATKAAEDAATKVAEDAAAKVAEEAAAKLAEEPAALAAAESPSVSNEDPKSEAPEESAEGYVDIGAVLLGEGGLAEKKSTRFVVPYEEPTGDYQADFEKMLSQFREKVSENIDANDVLAHYDLGTAYMEMGLLDEAISEFQVVLRGTSEHLPTYEMLGQTFLQKAEPEAALRSLERGLSAPCEVEEERVGISTSGGAGA
jgi:tetratricopeptide (TPR) repeat protein